ncbi:MAG: hypothetical protein HYV90_00805 [Candidatus Woesebacteria bacterium]|nr:MAG: hypothetical protein HYV90_00805 [Candidatus Woesebacteria bacterium]
MERLTHSGNFNYEIIKTSKKDRFEYSIGDFKYTPPGWVKIEKMWFPLGYKVVTQKNQSLGLRRNPTIYTYKIGEWNIMPDDQIIGDDVDEGGIFSGASLASARKTQKYCLERQKDPFETRIFFAAVYKPFLANGYKVKSQGIMLLEELK